MDPNQPITTVRHGVLNVLKKAKCFLRGLLEWLREEKNVNAIASWEMLTKKLVTHTKCSIT